MLPECVMKLKSLIFKCINLTVVFTLFLSTLNIGETIIPVSFSEPQDGQFVSKTDVTLELIEPVCGLDLSDLERVEQTDVCV